MENLNVVPPLNQDKLSTLIVSLEHDVRQLSLNVSIPANSALFGLLDAACIILSSALLHTDEIN